jgi:hypothetical protein
MRANGHSNDLRFVLGHIDDLNMAFLLRHAEVLGEPVADHPAVQARVAAGTGSTPAP